MKKLSKVVKVIGIVILSLLVSLLLFVAIYSQIGNNRITVEIDGLGTGMFVCKTRSLDRTEFHVKPVFSLNGKISFKTSVNKLSEVKIERIGKRTTFRSNRIQFFMDPHGDIKLKGKLNDISIDYDVISGNKLSFQYAELRKELLPFFEEESRLWRRCEELRETDRGTFNQVMQKFDSLRFFTVSPYRKEWAKQHLDYELAPFYLTTNSISADSVIKYNSLLAPNVKESPLGKKMTAFANGLKYTKCGTIAPDFSHKTHEGNEIKLEQFRGKYVVLDFWGSWCGPCLSGLPRMRAYYGKYKERIEFIGIACNDKEPRWRKAIVDNQINWPQILNDKASIDIGLLYGISSYPTKIIVNPKGEVINRFRGEVPGFYSSIDSIMIK